MTRAGILAIGLAAAGVATRTGREVLVAAGLKYALIALAVLVSGGLLQIRRARRLSKIGGGTGPVPGLGGVTQAVERVDPGPEVPGPPGRRPAAARTGTAVVAPRRHVDQNGRTTVKPRYQLLLAVIAAAVAALAVSTLARHASAAPGEPNEVAGIAATQARDTSARARPAPWPG